MTAAQMTALHPQLPFIEELRARNGWAFRKLYDDYAGALLGEVTRRVHDHQTAEDLLQESMISIFLHIETYDSSKGRLFTWMLTIVRNKCTDYQRSVDHRNRQRTAELVDRHAIPFCAPEIKLDATRLKERVNEHHAQDAKAFELIFVQGCTHEQTAELCRMPLGTVKTRMRSLLKYLNAV